jgi:hypothetical protein
MDRQRDLGNPFVGRRHAHIGPNLTLEDVGGWIWSSAFGGPLTDNTMVQGQGKAQDYKVVWCPTEGPVPDFPQYPLQ